MTKLMNIMAILVILALAGCVTPTVPNITPTKIPVTTYTTTPIKIPTVNNTPVNILNESIIYLTEGQRDGPFLAQKIYPDHIDGLIFLQYPVEHLIGSPTTVYIGQNVSNGCDKILTLLSIEDKKAKFLKRILKRDCPICLSENTSIDTPKGPINVQNLKEGMIVFSLELGQRKQSIILKTSKVYVSNIKVKHIILLDGREIFASSGHQLADERSLGSISTGDIIDNSMVIIADEVIYKGNYTYDILPSGNSGTYWANGILLKSTLIN